MRLPTTPVRPTSGQGPTSCPRPRTITSAPGVGRTVALTFDDGAAPATLAIAEQLKARHVTATFFDVGSQDATRSAVVQQVAALGFPVEDHSWEHAYPNQVPGGWTVEYLRDQITRTAALQAELTGHRPCFFRPPGGFLTNVRTAAYGMGLSVVLWSVDTLDWSQPALTTQAATAAIVSRATSIAGQQHPIVLMHAGKSSREPDSVVSPNRSNTVAALPAIIDWYTAHGYAFVAF